MDSFICKYMSKKDEIAVFTWSAVKCKMQGLSTQHLNLICYASKCVREKNIIEQCSFHFFEGLARFYP